MKEPEGEPEVARMAPPVAKLKHLPPRCKRCASPWHTVNKCAIENPEDPVENKYAPNLLRDMAGDRAPYSQCSLKKLKDYEARGSMFMYTSVCIYMYICICLLWTCLLCTYIWFSPCTCINVMWRSLTPQKMSQSSSKSLCV